MLGNLVQKFSRSLDLFFPPRCVHCKSTNSWLCSTCFRNIPFIEADICIHCGTPAPSPLLPCKQCETNALRSIDGIRVAAYFEDNPVRSAIHALKYRNHRAIVQVLADILANTYQHHHLSAQVIVPVPLYPARFRERGYNQSELLARQLGQLLALPVNTGSLQRIRATKSQMRLGAHERHNNVADAFSCSDEKLDNQRVLIIDDVCTTGSTLDFCAAALKECGAASVWGLTLAKAR